MERLSIDEVIGQLKYMYKTCMNEKCKHKGQCDLCCESKDMAIQALEEIQQYRAIGTVEELKKIEESFNVISDKVWYYILAGGELLERYEAIGTIDEFKDLKEKNEKQLEAIKLLTIAAICYEKNLDIIRKEMKENKELVTLYCKLPTVQYIKNTIALSKLADSDIDVNNIESIDEIIRIFDWQ